MLTSAHWPRDSAEVVLVGDGWSWVVLAEFPARDRPEESVLGAEFERPCSDVIAYLALEFEARRELQ